MSNTAAQGRAATPLRAFTRDSLSELAVIIEPDVDVPDCPNSLLELPVIRWLLGEQGFRLNSRCVDKRWDYAGVFDAPANAGLDPFGEDIFVPRISAVNAWLADPGRRDLARLNLDNRLLSEVFFVAHDLLHMWAYRRMMNHPQGFRFGQEPLDADSLDDYVFCHLVSEAVATAGLDYWYLSRMSVGRELGLPVSFNGLAVNYTRALDDFMASETEVTVHSPDFFPRLCTLYTTGALPGIERTALQREPGVDQWLQHELRYSVSQRLYTCAWFSFLGGLEEPSRERALRPISPDVPWRRRMVEDVGNALWQMTQTQRYALEPLVPATALPSPDAYPDDARFMNPALFTLRDAAPEDRALYKRLKAATYEYDSFTPAEREQLARTESLAAFHALLDRGRPLAQHDEPRMILQLN